MERLVRIGLDGGMTTTTTSTTSSPTLVIGGYGKTGRRVAQLLEQRDQPVRIGSRSAPTRFDWHDSSTWAAALDGVGRAYVTYSPDIAFPGALDHIAAFTAAAEASGLERIVLLSGRGEEAAQAAERVVLDSAVDATVVRCAFFAQNFTEDFLIDAVRQGVIALPAGDVAEPILDADDIADVVVAAFTEEGHVGKVYELTGPRLMTFHDVAAELGAATGRTITYAPVTPAQWADAAVADGLPAGEAEAMAELFAHIFDGHNASLADGVAEAMGREPRDFRRFAAAGAALGVWDLSAEAAG